MASQLEKDDKGTSTSKLRSRAGKLDSCLSSVQARESEIGKSSRYPQESKGESSFRGQDSDCTPASAHSKDEGFSSRFHSKAQSQISAECDELPKKENEDGGLAEEKSAQQSDCNPQNIAILQTPVIRSVNEDSNCNPSRREDESEFPIGNSISATAAVTKNSSPLHSARDRTVEGPSTESGSLSELDLELQMLEYTDCLFKRLPGLRSEIRNAQLAAGRLQGALGSRSKIHVVLETCVPSSPENNGQMSNEKIVVLPLFSSTLMRALKQESKGCSAAACALSEALFTASRISSSSRPSTTNEKPSCPKRPPDIPALNIPSWYPNVIAQETINIASLRDGENIVCNHDVMEKLNTIPASTFVSIYGLFFSALHGLAVRKKRVSGPITYSRMTPPWLRSPVVFVHGKGGNLFLRYDMCKLPPRNTGYGKEGRLLCRAIICTWLAREPETSQYLVQLLKSEKVYIYDEDTIKEESTERKRKRHIKIESAERAKKTKVSFQISARNPNGEENDLLIDGIRLGRHDLATLDVDTCVNDRIINGFFSLLKSSDVAVMDTYFSKFLMELGCAKVMKWTTKEILEECEICFLPLHSREQFHWGLAALFKSSREIRFYDSKEYLNSFSEQKQSILDWANNVKLLYDLSSWPAKWTIDQTPGRSYAQVNNTDCGVYVCINAFHLSTNTSPEIRPDSIPGFRRKIRTSLLQKRMLLG